MGRFCRQFALLFLLLGLLPGPAGAAVVSDFAPLDGIVILATPASCLIDRDAGAGVSEGDLFVVVGTGEELIHPISGAKLGRRETRKGIVRVVSLHSGYAEAVAVGPLDGAARGDRVQRFAGLPALFIDQTSGRGKELFEQLRRELPHLNWSGYFTAPIAAPAPSTPHLVFSAGDNLLEVREPVSGLLRRYPFTPPPAISPPAPAVPPAAAASTTVAEPWLGPTRNGRAAALDVADLDGDGSNEIIIASEHALEIGRLRGQDYTRIGGADYGLTTRILSLDSIDADGDGRPELWVTAASGEVLDSFVVDWHDNQLRSRARHLGWWFRVLPLPAQGRVLLGQRLGDGENDFSGPLLRLTLKDGKVTATTPVTIAGTTALYGLALLAPPGKAPVTVRLSLGDLLQVLTPSGEKLWESDEPYGGSELYFERPDLIRMQGDMRYVYVVPRLDALPNGMLLAPLNEGRRAVVRRREFNRSHLELLAWDGVALRSHWRSRNESGCLVDFRLADIDNDGRPEVAQLITYMRPGFSSQGRYALLVDKSFPSP